MKLYANTSVKSVDEKSRTATFIASTNERDSYGEIVEQKWQLERWLKNPAILWRHGRESYGGTAEEGIPIGRGLSAEVTENAMEIAVEFAPKELNEFADRVFRNVAAGFVKGGSVGFYPHSVRLETVNDVETWILSDNELLEFSVCPVGANPGAVALTEGDVSERHNLLRTLAAQETNMTKKTASAPAAEVVAPAEPVQLTIAQADPDPLPAVIDPDVVTSVKEAQEPTAPVVAELAPSASVQKELDDLKARNAQLERQVAELEIDRFIGTKLVPSERETAVADRLREGSEAFAKRMQARPDLQLTARVTNEGSPRVDLIQDGGARLARNIKEKANKANRSVQ